VTLEKNDQRMLLIGMAIVILSLALAGILGKPGGPGGGPPPNTNVLVYNHGQQTFTGSGNANTDTTYNFTVNQTHVLNVTVGLTWTDEASSGRRYTNTPDTLGLEVHSPDGTAKQDSGANPQGGAGSLTLKYQYNETDKKDPGSGSWDILVSVGPCGPQVPMVDFTGLREIADAGNAYTLTISYDYITYASPSKGAS
jgi:hypothetical protein